MGAGKEGPNGKIPILAKQYGKQWLLKTYHEGMVNIAPMRVVMLGVVYGIGSTAL